MGELFAILGASIAALLTYVLGRRSDRESQLRSEQISASVEYSEAVMQYSGLQVARRRDEVRGIDVDDAFDHEVRTARSRAWAAYFRIVLLVPDVEMRRLARVAIETTASLSDFGDDVEAVKERGRVVREQVEQFVDSLAGRIGGR